MNGTVNRLDPIDISRICQQQSTHIASSHETLTKTDHIQDHKTHLNTF